MTVDQAWSRYRSRALRMIPVLAVIALAACGGDSATAPGSDSSLGDRINFSTLGFTTDFSIHSVPYYEIVSGGPGKDGIPSIDEPRFIPFLEADNWLADREPVVALAVNGDARAYPLQILIWHEIVNDTVGGQPVTITFCPRCNSAIVWQRTLDGELYDFGVTGKLRFSDLIMYDRQTESWWQQLNGEAIVGVHTGKQLKVVPSTTMSYQDFRESFPSGLVLSRETGFPDYVSQGRYGVNPYSDYDALDESTQIFAGQHDARLHPRERVVAVRMGEAAVAYPFAAIERERVVNDEVSGTPLVVFFKPGTVSALDARIIAESRDVGAAAVYRRDPTGERLTFVLQGGDFTDLETGTQWNLAGRGVVGPLKGVQLEPIPHGDHFWFAWVAFQPDTALWEAEAE